MLQTASALIGALLGLPVLRYLVPPPIPPESLEAEIPDGEVGVWDSRLLLVAGRPAIVVNTPAGYAAFAATCSHLGCTVRWRRGRQEFFCPCHGGRFGLDGKVIGGPPRAPLRPLMVESRAQRIVVRST
jgi:cytochrome b6-f complex iron-sulfur subunit